MAEPDSHREPEAYCEMSQRYCPITPQIAVLMVALYCVRLFQVGFQMSMVVEVRVAHGQQILKRSIREG